MLKNFIIISFRNLVRQRGFSTINLLGLTMGLTISFLILLYIFNELSYDKYHDDADRIYRIAVKGNLGEMPLNVAVTPGALAHNLTRDMPGIEEHTMFEHLGSDQLFRNDDKKYYENHLIYADSNFFKVFSFNFLYGDPRNALNEPYTIVLKESLAKQFFGTANCIGKDLKINNENNYRITAVIQDPPQESHLPVNFIASFSTRIRENGPGMLEDWGAMMYYSYIKLDANVKEENFEEKIKNYFIEKLDEEVDDPKFSILPDLQPVTSIHLNSRLLGELKPNSDISYIYILSLIAIAILFIAGINFMNLSTARSAGRAKEVSIRKILGSTREKLIYQFIGESVFLSLLAFLFALVLIEILLPVFNNLTHKSIGFDSYFNFELILIFLGITLLIGVFSGSYPAFYLSSFNPVKVLHSGLKSGNPKKSLRNILVFIQFMISTGLIASTFIIFTQLDYIREKKLGFDKDNSIAIFLRNAEIKQNAASLKEEFTRLAAVESASLASSIPGMSLNGSSYFPDGYSEEAWLVYEFDVDEDFIEKTFGMDLISGRNFSSDFYTDSSAIIINETLQKKLRWENAIGKTFRSNNDRNDQGEKHVIGVVKDFHFRSLHEKIEPTMIHFSQSEPGLLILRLNPGNIENTMKLLERTWNDLNPELPFVYEFIDESFNGLYNSEQRLSYLFTYLSIFAIFIASLGLLGLVSFTAEQRTKEIGIRRTLGASSFSISKMFSKEYIRLIILSSLLAGPLSYIFMEKWLQNFSYRINLPVWPFISAGIIILIISLLVINIQTLKTTMANPLKSLRYE
ncbi:MAG: FtsX-like permease family protein [Bacteroidota bacterium]